jgi:hypothetical protein
MPHNTSGLEAVATIGIDIGKNTFHLVGLDRNGAIVLRQNDRLLAQMRSPGMSAQWPLLGGKADLLRKRLIRRS